MKKSILYVFLLLVVAGCSKTVPGPADTLRPSGGENVILRVRAADLPGVPSQGRPLVPADAAAIPVDEYAGCGYRLGNTVAGDAKNLGFRVVDLARLQEAHPQAVDILRINSAGLSSVAYAADDDEGNCSLLQVKIGGDFTLNTESVMRQRSEAMKQLFKPYLSGYSQSIFGELHLEVLAYRYALYGGSAFRREIGACFLDTCFLEALYNTPLQQVTDAWGLFVIAGYYTGGQMTALYCASPGELLKEEQARGMKMVMDHSYVWAPGTLVFGREKGNIQATADAFRLGNIRYVLHTQGGSWQPTVGTLQNGTDDFTDLTPWLHSLSDEDTHALAGFPDGGLRPLSDFVLEENFRGRINDTHHGYRESTELTEPYIAVMKVLVHTVDGEPLYKAAPVLHSRQGDLLILSDGLSQDTDAELRANSDDAVFLQRAEAIAVEKSRYYRCGIEAHPSGTLNPVLRIQQNYDISRLDESRMFRWYNPSTGMHYLCDPVAKVALSWYRDAAIPATYGLSEWIASLPEREVTIKTLCESYRVIGL